MANPVWVQEDWRFGLDDDVLEANTLMGTANNQNQTLTVDTNYRLRFVVQQTNVDKNVNNQIHELWASYEGGTYFQVTSSSSYVALVDDANSIADHATTAQRIGDGTYETSTEKEGYNDGTTDDDTGVCDGTGGTEMEMEHCISITSGEVNDGDEIEFEMRLDGGTQYGGGYGARPLATVDKPAVQPNPQVSDSASVSDTPVARPTIGDAESETIASTTDTPDADIPIEDAETETISSVADSPALALSNLTITKSETIASVTDTPSLSGLTLPPREASASESAGVTDSPTPAMSNIAVAESESTSVSDSPGRNLISLVGESESATVADTPQYYSDLVTTLDRVSVSVVTPGVVDRDVAESESVTGSDSPSLSIAVAIPVSESASASDSPVATIGIEVAESESANVTDSPAEEIPLEVAESEGVSVADSPSLTLSALVVSESESASVSDSPALLQLSYIAESESASASDAPALALSNLEIAESESAGVSDAPLATVVTPGVPNVNVSDSASVADDPTVALGDLAISESEGASASDAPAVRVTSLIAASDGASVADSPTLAAVLLEVTASEATSVADAPIASVSAAAALSILESESASISDSLTIAISTLSIATSESASVAGSPIVAVGALVALDISESEAASVSDALIARPEVRLTTTESASISDTPTAGGILLLFTLSESIAVAEHILFREVTTPSSRTFVVTAVSRVLKPESDSRVFVVVREDHVVEVS